MSRYIQRLAGITLLVLAVLGGGVVLTAHAATSHGAVNASPTPHTSTLALGPLVEYLWS